MPCVLTWFPQERGTRDKDLWAANVLWDLSSGNLSEGLERGARKEEKLIRGCLIRMISSVGLISLRASEELLECSLDLSAEELRRGVLIHALQPP